MSVDLLTTSEVAVLCGVSQRTIARWADSGYLPVAATAGRARLFDPVKVDRFVRKLADEAEAELCRTPGGAVMTTDPLEALKALREDPFADWRDAATILPAALSHLCAIADDLADDTADDLARSLAVSLGDVLIAATTLGVRVPARPAPDPEHHEDPWAWAWPEELRVGMKIRFPKDEGGFGPWRAITAVPTQFYAAWGRAFYLDDDEHVTNIGNKRMVQTLLTDPDAVADFYAGKRDRMVQP